MTVPFDAFGPGKVFVTNILANSTPVNIGYSQEFSLDFNANVKELTGEKQFPLDVARGVTKVSGKIKAAVISGIAWNSVFFGQSLSTGGFILNDKEAGTIPGTPYQITVANAATYEAVSTLSPNGGDLGVIDASTGLPFTKVASSPATGQYSVNPATGVYTFAAADTGKAVLISYRSTVSAGQKLTVTNKLLGDTPIFSLDYYTTRNSKPFLIRLPQCTAKKVTIAAKLEDFMMPEFDFEAFGNAADEVVQFSYPEVS